MEKPSSSKTKLSLRMKIAAVSATVLVIGFFAFPLIALAHSQGSELSITLPGGLGRITIPNLPNLCGGCNGGSSSSDASNASDASDASDANNAKGFEAQLQKCLKLNGSQLPKCIGAAVNELVAACGNNDCGCNVDCGSNNNGLRNNVKQSAVTFKLIGVFERSGKPLVEAPARQNPSNAPTTIVKVKSLQNLQEGFFVEAEDAKGDTFMGQVIRSSTNTSRVKEAVGVVKGQSTPERVALTL